MKEILSHLLADAEASYRSLVSDSFPKMHINNVSVKPMCRVAAKTLYRVCMSKHVHRALLENT